MIYLLPILLLTERMRRCALRKTCRSFTWICMRLIFFAPSDRVCDQSVRFDWFISPTGAAPQIGFLDCWTPPCIILLVWLSVARPLIRILWDWFWNYIIRAGCRRFDWSGDCATAVLCCGLLSCFNCRWRLFKHPRLGQSTGAVTQERQPLQCRTRITAPHWSDHSTSSKAAFLRVSSFFYEKNSSYKKSVLKCGYVLIIYP